MKDYYTTCEIAKFCGVSRITVKNWLEKELIPHFRTSGGHRRVKRENLLSFMKNKNYPFENMEKYEEGVEVKKKKLYCWEYFSKKFTEKHSNKCDKCIVMKAHSYYCYELVKEIGSDKVLCGINCSDCDFYKKINSVKVKANIK